MRKRYIFFGLVVCGAAYYGARKIHYYYFRRRNSFKRSKSQDAIPSTLSLTNTYNRHLNTNNMNSATTASSIMSSWTSRTSGLMFFDIEPNLHFFKIYQDQLAIADSIPVPRTERVDQLFCESREEFLAKVSCLRTAFQDLLYCNEHCSFFIHSGRDILSIFLSHSQTDLEKCLEAYDNLLQYVSDTKNHDDIESELATRNIPMLTFYDLVVDYIILESLDDLENPPAVVSSIVSNKWVSSKFRQSACQSAVATALKYKRSQLKRTNGFFAHFYSLLDYLSPTLAWGFLGSDEDLQIKCGLLKECLTGLCRDYFSFDRVRYTSYQDLKDDIITVTRERYYDLTDRLSL